MRFVGPGFVLSCLLLLPAGAEEAGAVFQLEDIAVTGTRGEKRLKDSPVVTEVISAEEIENSSAATVTEVLDDYGLIYAGNATGDYVQLQGMGEGRVLFLIDGRRVAGRIAQRLKGDTLPLANVERIEIVRGPQSALYGSDGIGGVINIITKKPGDDFSLSASLSDSFLPAHDDPKTSEKPGAFEDFNPLREQRLTAAAGFPIGRTRNSINLEGSRGAFYLNEAKNSSLLPEYYRGRAGLDISFPLGDKAEMSAGGSFMAMRSDSKINSSGALERLSYIRADGYVEAELSPLENGTLTLRLSDNFYQRDKDGYSGILKEWYTGEHHENENLAVLEAAGVYDGIANFLFTAGIEGAVNTMDKYNLLKDGTFAAVDKEALYFQAEYFREDRYSFIAGLRGERNSQFGLAGAPKLSALYHLPRGFRLLGGAGLGYRAPDFNDLYLRKDDNDGSPLVLGNEGLTPEYALGFNLALEYAKPGRFFAQINGYYDELFNEIVYQYQGYQEKGKEVYRRDNIFRSLRAGLDTEGRLTVFGSGFVSAGYSWLYAYDRTQNEELRLQPAHTVKMKLGWDHKKSGINAWLGGRFFSALKTTGLGGTGVGVAGLDTGGVSYDARFILDFYVSLAFAKHFKVHVAADNITGLIHVLSPAVGRTFTVGLKYFL
jgi:outer membrane receptor for ferrienterochelin and colicins